MYEDDKFKLSEKEIYLFHEGTYCYAYKKFGAHAVIENDVSGVRFTVWAPNAIKVGVAGEFNNWEELEHLLVRITDTGIWTAFFAGLQTGQMYKFAVYTLQGEKFLKADPFAFYSEQRPKTASIICSKEIYNWEDEEWQKKKEQPYQKPINIYEVHLGSWRRKPDGSFMNYREIAHEMADYALRMGYTHLELLPVMEHPFDDSWGYQVTGYYSVTSRYGTPEDFKYFVEHCHKRGLGIILDWVPSHFCRDEHGLVCFDGTKLYEAGESAQWGTYYFDFSKPEVVSFLISNAIYWFEVFHVDGLRVDAVASMLYLDYGKEKSDWVPNKYGGNEQIEAVNFIKQLHVAVFRHIPNPLMIAEESTSWPLVTKPTYDGGLGFNYKWNMGWMNDILEYMSKAINKRKAYHHKITFSFLYAFSENFILPLSHDEVVHGKKALIDKMPGDYWQKFANLRLLFGYMIAHPGKKLVFMGGELAQFHEWRPYEELYWRILDFDMHRSFQQYVKELNHFYIMEKALWEQDHEWKGFSWIEADNSEQSVAVFLRKAQDNSDFLVIICNFTSIFFETYQVGVPNGGWYQEAFNSDNELYGGSGQRNIVSLRALKRPWQKQKYSLVMKLPPLSIVFIRKK